MDMVPVPGGKLSSRSLGRVGGTPTVLLHGLVTGNMASWYFGVGLPLSASRRVVLYDQRGHGDSTLPQADAPAHFDLDSQVADLEAVLAYHGMAGVPIDVVGHSMGALVALRFALRKPRCVRRLVLIDAPMPAQDYAGPSLAGVTSPAQIGDLVESLVPPAGRGRRQERLRNRLLALFERSSLIRDVLAMGPESEAELAGLGLPALLVYGRHSPCVAAGIHLRRLLPLARLELLDCGHYVLEEAAAPLREHIDRFLSAEEISECAGNE